MTSLSESEFHWKQDDGHGRQLVCAVTSPDSQWSVALYGPNKYCDFLYGYARCADGWRASFACGYPVTADRVAFRWDLPNDSWGVFLDGQCWAIYANRPASRSSPRRFLDRTAPHQQPFTNDEIVFACAKRRYQKQGTHGGVLEP